MAEQRARTRSWLLGGGVGEELGLLTGGDVLRVGRELRLTYVGLTTTGLPSNHVYITVNAGYDASGFVVGSFGLGYATK